MYVCTYVWVCIYMYVCMHVYIYIITVGFLMTPTVNCCIYNYEYKIKKEWKEYLVAI